MNTFTNSITAAIAAIKSGKKNADSLTARVMCILSEDILKELHAGDFAVRKEDGAAIWQHPEGFAVRLMPYHTIGFLAEIEHPIETLREGFTFLDKGDTERLREILMRQ